MMAGRINEDLGRVALLLFVESARYLRAEAAKTVVVVPSSLISITMAPEVTTVAPTKDERVLVVVEVEVEDTVTVLVLALVVELELAKLDN